MSEKFEDRFKHAIKLEKSGQIEDAVKEYSLLIKEDKNYRNAYLNLGALYARMKMYAKAMDFYKRSLSLKEDYLVYFNIGSIYYKNGEYKKSIIHLEKSKQLKNDYPLSLLVIGLCYSRLNNIAAALSNFQSVISISPHNRVALTALAIIYFNEKDFSESTKHVNTLLSLDENNKTVQDLKTSILYETNQIDEFNNEIKTIKKQSSGYMYYDEFIKAVPVETYTDRYGTLEEKIEFLEERAQEDRNSMMSLSLCHLIKGDTDKALDYLMEIKKRFK